MIKINFKPITVTIQFISRHFQTCSHFIVQTFDLLRRHAKIKWILKLPFTDSNHFVPIRQKIFSSVPSLLNLHAIISPLLFLSTFIIKSSIAGVHTSIRDVNAYGGADKHESKNIWHDICLHIFSIDDKTWHFKRVLGYSINFFFYVLTFYWHTALHFV